MAGAGGGVYGGVITLSSIYLTPWAAGVVGGAGRFIILVSRGNLIDALFEDVVQGMRDVARMPGVVDGCAHARGQTDLPVNAFEQQRPQVRR